MKKLLHLLGLTLCGLASSASAAIVNVSPGTIAIATQSSDIGYPAANALNRNYDDFTHTAAEATDNWWRLDMGGPVPVQRVVLFNRTSCCGERLRDITISFYDTNNVLITSSPLLNPANVLGSPATITYSNASPVNARYVQVTRTATGGAGDHGGNTLSLAEVEIYASNIANGQPTTQSSTYASGYEASRAVDGNPLNFSHTAAEATPNWWQVDLGNVFEVNSVLLLNRGDTCCPERLRDITISVLDTNLLAVYSSPLLNPANASSGPKSLGVDIRFLNGGPVLGRYVRVTRTATGANGDHAANVLALSEVQVYGSVPSGLPASITTPPQNQHGVVGGSATFTAAAVGSEPLGYQWRRSGTNLPGQTSSTLSLANLTLADAGNYSVTVTNAFGTNTSTSASLTVFIWNAARAGTASQSTTDNGGVASRAIDGNTDGNWGNGSVTHTGNTPIDNEWWEVDLGALTYVDRIQVWFRTDCCQTRNENLRLVIYDSAGPGRQIIWTQNVGANPGANKAFDVSPAMLGRVVRVEHPAGFSEVLSLAEVQVFEGPHDGLNLLWVGGNPDATWDTTNTFNWDDGIGAQVFHLLDSVTFDNSSVETSVTLSGTLSPKIVNVSGDQTYVFQGSGAMQAKQLVKTGGGTLTLANNGANNLTLGTLISEGTLQIGNGGTVGALPGGPITNHATVAFNRSDDLAVSPGMQGSGRLLKQGANILTLSGASGQGGGTVVASGTVRLQNNDALGNTASAITIVSNGATLDLSSYELWNYAQPLVVNGSGVGGVGAITKSATGNGSGQALRSLTLGSDATLGGVADARIDLGRGDWGGATVTAPIHLDGQSHTLTVVGNLYFGILAGAQNLAGVNIGSGAVVAPHADNSFGGATVTLNGGTLSPWGVNHLFANPLVVNSGFIDNQAFFNTYLSSVQVNGPLQINSISGGNIMFSGNISGAGAIRKIGAYSVLLGGNNSGLTGSYTNDESNTFLTSDNSGSAQAAWTVNTGIFASDQPGSRVRQLGSLGGAGGIVANNLANPDTGDVTFIIGSNHTSTAFAGQILDTVYQAGTVAIVKVGSGTLTLSGSSAYSGGTLVAGGSLRIDGSLNGGAGAVTVAGGTLGGNGLINAAVNVQAGGTVAPGASVGVLTISNTLTLGGVASFEIDKAGATNDLVRGLSAVTYGGTLRVTNLGGVLVDGDVFKLFDAAAYSGSFAVFELPTLSPTLEWRTAGLLTNGSLVIGPVNHPPVAANHTLGTSMNHPQNISTTRLLNDCTDPDGDPLTVSAVSAASTNGGTVVLLNTNVTYTPVSNYTGPDAFTFTISDGRGGMVQGTVLVTVSSSQAQNIVSSSYDAGTGTFTLTFAGIPGNTCRVQSATTLTPPADWTDFSTNTVPPLGLFQVTNFVGGSTTRFYRTVSP